MLIFCMREPENEDQAALRKWITAGLQISEVRNLSGDAGYLFSNMIAKYTLASSEYQISEAALNWFKANTVDLSIAYARSRFYGKNSPLMYEHTIPASVIREVLLEVEPTEPSVHSVLQKSGHVVVVMRSEDEELIRHGLSRKMPEGWRFGENPYARYDFAGIELSKSFLRVKGKIQR